MTVFFGFYLVAGGLWKASGCVEVGGEGSLAAVVLIAGGDRPPASTSEPCVFLIIRWPGLAGLCLAALCALPGTAPVRLALARALSTSSQRLRRFADP